MYASQLISLRTALRCRLLFTEANSRSNQEPASIKFGKRLSRSAASAVLIDEPDGDVRLQLQLMQSLVLGDPKQDCDTPITSVDDVVVELEVKPTRSWTRTRAVAENVAKDDLINKSVQSQRNMQANRATWDSLLQKLEERTQPIAPDQVTVKVCGPINELEELYYAILGDGTFGLTVDYPKTVDDATFILCAGGEKSINDLTKFLSSSDEWRALSINCGPKSVRSSSGLARPTVQGSSTRAAPRALDFILAPRDWTKASFVEHVRAVVTSRPPQVLHQHVQHKDIVHKILLELFFNLPNTRQVLSWAAYHIAITYLLRQGKVLAARQMLKQMDRNGFPPSVETFNIFLRSCAEDQNMVAFRNFLEIMHADRINPSEGTWIALMAGAPTVTAQQAIARAMFRRGFSVRAAFARDNAPQVIPYSFGQYLDSGGHVSEYFETMDDLYGPTWLTVQASAHLMDGLASRGRIAEAIKLVDTMAKERSLIPTKDILHALLLHCKQQLNADLAIWLMIYAREKWRLSDWDHIVSDRFFEIAWRARMYNVLKVVWKYSCAYGSPSFSQRNRIYKSLISRLQLEQEGPYGNWLKSAGAVACGKDPLSISSHTPDAILKDERFLFGSKPLVPVTVKLAGALLMDKRWIEGKAKKTRGVAWKIRHSISVPFAPKLFSAVLATAKPEPIPQGLRKIQDGSFECLESKIMNTQSQPDQKTKTLWVTRRLQLSRLEEM